MFHVKHRDTLERKIMAYVTPNSTLQLFKGINLDNRYLHTALFEASGQKTASQVQDEWFTDWFRVPTVGNPNPHYGKAFSFTGMMYKRYTANSVKIEADAISLLGVTYMRFQNTRANKGKWFYAFVLNVDYVNENTAIVYYEIDVMQTWFIQNGAVRPCMIRREHVSSDTFSTHLEQEPIGSEVYDMDYICNSGGMINGQAQSSKFGSYCLVINSSAVDPNDTTAMMNNGLFNGTKYTAILPTLLPADAIRALDDMLGSWDKNEQTADIIDMFTFPQAFCSKNASDNTYTIKVPFPRTTPTDPQQPAYPTISGYKPKNNKLFAYPYSLLYATTMDGDDAEYRWEYFDGDVTTSNDGIDFVIYGNPLGGGSIVCYPKDGYNGVDDNYNAKLTLSNFPKNAYAYDAYQAWVASGGRTKLEKDSEVITTRGIQGMAVGIATGGLRAALGVTEMLGGIGSLVATEGASILPSGALMARGAANIAQGNAAIQKSVADWREGQNKIAYQWNDAQYRPNVVRGSSTPNCSVSLGVLDFYFYHCHVRLDEAKKIDEFFTVFGYACNKVKTPNLHSRQYWNFVQTENAIIDGEMPASSKEAIGRILDGGITFWHNVDQIGNYAQSVTDGTINNPIVT